ncbi:MAG: ABC transporter permease [Solirubrobacteraceae bacterium]
MLRVALKGLATRRLRAALTALAVVLGVALVAGTYVLTDSIDGAFSTIFQSVYRGTSATVTGRNALDTGADGGVGGGAATPAFPQSLLARVTALPDVEDALGGVSGTPQLIVGGKAISFGGAPNLGFSVDPSKPRFNSLKLVRGSWPGPSELVIDDGTASKEHLHPGDLIGVQDNGPVVHMRISGLVQFGSANSLGGATLAGFRLPTAQRLFHKQGRLDDIRVAAKPGVSPQRLVAQIRPILPGDAQVRTGSEQASKDQSSISSFISTLKTILLGFAGVALFVGSFVSANSLSITIAQRTRELATLRTLGASRRQVLRAVMVESAAIGAIASVIGLGVGLALAQGLFALFDATGLTLPNTGTVIKPRTVIVAIGVGIVVTMLASLRPALRATRVEPIAAVREGATLPESRFAARYRTAGSATTVALGVAALLLGLFAAHGTGPILALMGAGAVLVFIGVAMLSARIVPVLATWIGWPATRIAGAIGSLARENARRNPRRTASTASALMIGLALVTLIAMMSAGIISNFKGAVNDLFAGNYAITAQNNFSPIPIAAGRAAGHAPGVTAVGSVRSGQARAFGSNMSLTAVDPSVAQVIRIRWIHGSQALIGALGASGAFTDDSYASKHHLHVGSPVSVKTPTGEVIQVTIRGIFKPPDGGSPFGPITISAARFDRLYQQPENLYSFVKMRGGQSAANEAALRRALAPFPGTKVQTRQQFIDDQVGSLSRILNIFYVLLALSIIVSLFGIVNTLVLSVFERTREIGMLRAVGTSRRQIRRMVRHESVITALIGSVIGIVLGIAFGALLAARVNSIAFTIPVGTVIVLVIAAWVVGLLAAIFPARRAAKLQPLQALAYE